MECGDEEGDTEEEGVWRRSREHIEGETRGERAWREGGRKPRDGSGTHLRIHAEGGGKIKGGR